MLFSFPIVPLHNGYGRPGETFVQAHLIIHSHNQIKRAPTHTYVSRFYLPVPAATKIH